MKSSSATSRMRVRVSCGGLTARSDMVASGEWPNRPVFKRTFEYTRGARAASRLAGHRDRFPDEGFLVVLVLDLVGEQQVELGLVARLHRRALDHHARYRADVLGEALLGALEDLEREAARGGRGGGLR